MRITKKVAPVFEDFIFDWDYEKYLLIGGYGSGKSYHIAFKIILKLIEEKRKALVVREVYDTIQESCYDLLYEILDDMGILTEDRGVFNRTMGFKVLALRSPLKFKFSNGSQIIFKGMDKPAKFKSINGVSIVWLEECSEIKFAGYEELLGRIRTPNVTMHFILSTNPVSKENWVYKHFFKKQSSLGGEIEIVNEERFYDRRVIVKNGVYYHHSLPTDNPWLPVPYINRLEDIKTFDEQLYEVARWGRFGVSGTRVLPQVDYYRQSEEVLRNTIQKLGPENMYFGFDFGFEESYNAVLCMSVDVEKAYLYIWDEIYINHVTDDKMAQLPEMQALKERIDTYNEQGYNKMIVADNEDPKAIQFYRQCGFKIRACKNKFAGSRLSNTRKIKRFKRILVANKCVNTLRELKDLVYAKDKNGDTIYDEFNIDPHTFSAIWYALDTVTVADYKGREFYSKTGAHQKLVKRGS